MTAAELTINKMRPSEHIKKAWEIFLAHGCKKILDAGCGTGWFGKYKPNGIKVVGFDISDRKLDEAKEHEIVVRGDVRNIPFDDESFDGLLAFHIIEHVLRSLAPMKEFARVLREGGIIIAESPSPWSDSAWADYTHFRPHTVESFTSLARDAGLEVLSCHYLGNSMSMPLLGKLGLSSLASKIRIFLAKRLWKAGRGNVFLVARKPSEPEKYPRETR